MVERAGLENRCTASRYRGFESHLLRYQLTRTFGLRTRNAVTPARVTFVFRTFSLTIDSQDAKVARPPRQ